MRWHNGEFELLYCSHLLAEYREKLASKRIMPSTTLNFCVNSLPQVSQLTYPLVMSLRVLCKTQTMTLLLPVPWLAAQRTLSHTIPTFIHSAVASKVSRF